MKEKNILIIGNGFDLALKRKTKYEDFIKFACQIVGFPDRDKKYISLSETFSYAVSPETILESFNSNKNVLTYEIIEKIHENINNNKKNVGVLIEFKPSKASLKNTRIGKMKPGNNLSDAIFNSNKTINRIKKDMQIIFKLSPTILNQF